VIDRTSENILKILANEFKIIGITGPRQSGKTTLAKKVFNNKKYVSLENPDHRLFAEDDPRGFLSQYSDGVIIDEIQHVPVLFSYLQELVDSTDEVGKFIITGSQNFNLIEKISQSLAGRIGMLQLLPFSINELRNGNIELNNLNKILYFGSYPPIYDRLISPERWYNSYINTYIERDVRQMINVRDLSTFQRFLKLCAGNIGQLVNFSRIGADCGINQQTVSSWINILEASYIVFRLYPHYENFRKRLVKTPKLYFYDTGLALRLLGLEKHEQLFTFNMRGSIFENWVISELIKFRYNKCKDKNFFFWRNNIGDEIDIVIDKSDGMIPIEVKSGATVSTDWFLHLNKWKKLAENKCIGSYLVYGGDTSQERSGINIIPWSSLDKISEIL
jgi:uncharacterized protein